MSWTDDHKANLRGKFIGFDGLEQTVHLKSDYKMEKAIKRPLKIEQIEDQLQKTGETPFKIRNVSIEYPGDLFSPISKLNHFRRKFLEKAELKLLKTYKPSKLLVQESERRFNKIKKSFYKTEQRDEKIYRNPVLAVYADSIDTVKGALEGGAERVYFEPNPMKNYRNICNLRSQNPEISSRIISDQREFNEISSLLEHAQKLCLLHDVEFIWKWPQITHQHQIKNNCKVLKTHLKHGLKEVMVDGLGAASAIKNVVPDINLSGSAGLNIWNRYSVLILSKIFNTVTPSAELSMNELQGVISGSRLSDIQTRFELVVQGNVDTLISKDCLLSIAPKREIKNFENQFWGIQDEKNHIFPIKIDSEGHTHILNSVELCLIDHLPKITKIEVDNIIVDLRNKTFDYAVKMTSIYAKGLEYIEKDVITAKKLNQLKSEIKLISTGGITTGNFLTGVKNK
jgi:putative protease